MRRLFKIIIGTASGLAIVIIGLLSYKSLVERFEKIRDDLKKSNEFYSVLVRWIQMHNENRNMTSYLVDHGYYKVAIYGMRELGQCLLDELRKTNDISVEYVIDRNADISYGGLKPVSPDDKLGDVDVIIVTAIHYYSEIEELLREKVHCDVISIEDILFA